MEFVCIRKSKIRIRVAGQSQPLPISPQHGTASFNARYRVLSLCEGAPPSTATSASPEGKVTSRARRAAAAEPRGRGRAAVPLGSLGKERALGGRGCPGLGLGPLQSRPGRGDGHQAALPSRSSTNRPPRAAPQPNGRRLAPPRRTRRPLRMRPRRGGRQRPLPAHTAPAAARAAACPPPRATDLPPRPQGLARRRHRGDTGAEAPAALPCSLRGPLRRQSQRDARLPRGEKPRGAARARARERRPRLAPRT